MWRSILLVGGAVVVACGFVAGLLALTKGNKVTDEPKLLSASEPEEKPAEEVKAVEVEVIVPVKPAEPSEPRPKKSPKREAADRIKQKVRKFNGRDT
jgi:hypothetical protein